MPPQKRLFFTSLLALFFCSGILFSKDYPMAKKADGKALKTSVNQMKAILSEVGKSSESSVGTKTRENQVRQIRGVRDELLSIQPNLSPKNRRLADPLRLELEKLTFSLAAGDEKEEVRRHLNNADTLLTVFYNRVSMACASCQGKGRDYYGALCKICGGDGYVSTSSDPKPCAACQGKGKDYYGAACQACKGTGWAETNINNPQNPPNCGGGATVSSPCASCQGKGKDYYGALCKICGGDGYVSTSSDPKPCAACQGKGKDYYGAACQACKGTGWAETGFFPGSGGAWNLKVCGTCKGAGKDYYGAACKPCGGDGFVAVAGEAKPCAACQGKGKDYYGASCQACQGTGWAETGENPTWGGSLNSAQCSFCQGKGKDYYGALCKICGGDGFVSTPSDQKPCASCNGKGKDYYGATCTACKGIGWARLKHDDDSNVSR